MNFDERKKRWFNPTLIIQSENAFSIVAKDELSSEYIPFKRLYKQKDEYGDYVIFRKNRVYRKEWKAVYSS